MLSLPLTTLKQCLKRALHILSTLRMHIPFHSGILLGDIHAIGYLAQVSKCICTKRFERVLFVKAKPYIQSIYLLLGNN